MGRNEMSKKRKKGWLRRLAALGILCCLVSGSTLTAGAAEGTAVDSTVSGGDVDGSKEGRAGADSLEEESALIDLSDLIYQAGGWGIPAGEELIQLYAITDADRLETAIFNALQNSAEELDVREFGLTKDDLDTVRTLVAKVVNGNPGLFYGASYMGYSYYGEDIFKLWFYYGNYSQEDRQAYAAKIEQAAALVTPEMTDMEKALVLHDYLAQNCSYAYREYLDGTWSGNGFTSAYSALVGGRAVCNGYALAYDALLRAVGIESFTCSGNVTTTSEGHAWNIIKIDGEWYHVDVTWDDPVWNVEGKVRHEYFLLSDAEMENRKHYGWRDHPGWNPAVSCTSAKYDSFWWRNIDSRIVVYGGNQYCYIISNNKLADAGSKTGFVLLNRNGDSVSTKYSSNAVWEVWNGGGRYWSGGYAYLSGQDGCVYFNDKQNLYAMKPSDSEPEIIYTYNGGDGYIYGAMVYADGTARLNISTTPSRESDSYITVDLKGIAPVLAADYTNKILPTTASMEYSLDNGIHWTRCTDNMKLEAFGWNGSQEVSVLVRYLAEAAGGFASQTAAITLQTRPGTLSGTVKCPGDKAGQTAVQILNGAGKVVYEAKASSGNDSFVLQDVAAGTYTMRISRPSYVTREYPLTMADQAVSRDVELWLQGDLNGDGRINAMDKRIIYNHVAGSTLTGYEFLVGDVDGNGEINARDKRMIYNHIAGTSLLWQ